VPQALDVAKAQAQVADQWRQKLGVSLQVPAAGQALVDTLRTAVAHMLISRVGPRLQPGTRRPRLDPRWRDDFRGPAAHGAQRCRA
jgi:hypothetical protein